MRGRGPGRSFELRGEVRVEKSRELAASVHPAPRPALAGRRGRGRLSAMPERSEEEKLPEFEEALDQIQQIIDGIESGEVPLAESLDKYARGMKLINHCRSILGEAETRIRRLTVDAEGNVVEADSGPDADRDATE